MVHDVYHCHSNKNKRDDDRNDIADEYIGIC